MQATFSAKDSPTVLPDELDVELDKLTQSPLQQEWIQIIGAQPEEVYSYICDPANLKDWMPFISDSWADNTKSDSGPGVVRTIQAWDGSMTLEEVKYQTFPMLCYSCVKETLGHSNHLGVMICLPYGDDGTSTKLIWRTYAKMTSNWLVKTAGSTTFYYIFEHSLNNLSKKWQH